MIIELYILLIQVLELAVVRRLFHAGLRDIFPSGLDKSVLPLLITTAGRVPPACGSFPPPENRVKYETIASLPGFGMAPEEPLLYSWGPNIGTRRATPCLVRVRIDLILAKG